MEQESKSNEAKEVIKEIIGWEDNKLFRTIKFLTTNPGKLISEYCNEEKQKYLSPIIYFFGATALEAFIATVSGLYDFLFKEKLESIIKYPLDSKLDIDVSSAVDRINTNFLPFFFSETGQKIILIPLLLLLTWLFYRKYNKSFKENSWFALYTLGHATLLSIPFIAIWYVSGDIIAFTAFSFIIQLVYWIWASRQFYNLKIGRAILLLVMFAIVMLTIGVLSSLMVWLTIMSS